MLTHELANEIVKQTMIRLNRNINIMNHTGTIIASGTTERIGQLHEGALEVIKTGKTLVVDKSNLSKWKGSLFGVNLPIEFQGKIIGVIGITGEPEKTMEFGELAKMITEMMLNQSLWASRLESKQRMKELIFEDLLLGKTHEESAERRQNAIHIQLTPPFLVIVLEIGETVFNKLKIIEFLENILGEKKCLIGFLNVNKLFILFSGLKEELLRKKIEEISGLLRMREIPSRIGVGTIEEEKIKIKDSLKNAESALKFGDNEKDLTYFNEVEVMSLLSRIPEHHKHLFSKRIMGHIPEKWIKSLETYFECDMNLAETAERLGIHRNTLIYRLKKVKDDTGYNPQTFHDATALQLAFWINQINK
ncbi:CdaR family transcriptional regulator [Falsibacillus pallidus]|uniref:CdaR family transcriptional regulator n=1 Tax=Falsibacillus pallidus TaxID=493781 RepID=A0A370GHL5_9BACI|nr:sugar diacid recognition domain-containing protein [Falsibacillus pallidus]RDI41874.1 CdaR family transcriptional regulator [Falsibacillus pallidus]